MTIAFSNPALAVASGVYRPQEDSRLLVDTISATGVARGQRVADLCTGSGIVAVNAALQGAGSITGFDVSPAAVRCARANAAQAGVGVEVHLGSWARAMEFGPFDVVLSNPPYVPHDPAVADADIPPAYGMPVAWDAGPDGRSVLDPLCEIAGDLLADRGTLMGVHSEFARLDQTVDMLRRTGLNAEIVAEQWVPFGPVLAARAAWLERIGLLEPGRRTERLGVVRAQKT